MDKNENASIIHCASWKIRRVVRSPLAAEVCALTDCFYFCFTLSYDISKMLGKKILIYLLTDSKLIFDTVTKLSNVSEKRLMVDISSLRQSYNSGEIESIGHVLTEYNLADPLTKKMKSTVLRELMATGKITYPASLWILHSNEA